MFDSLLSFAQLCLQKKTKKKNEQCLLNETQ